MRDEADQVRVPSWNQFNRAETDDPDEDESYEESYDDRRSRRGNKKPNFLTSLKDKLVNIISESEDDDEQEN
mgnify:FL=1